MNFDDFVLDEPGFDMTMNQPQETTTDPPIDNLEIQIDGFGSLDDFVLDEPGFDMNQPQQTEVGPHPSLNALEDPLDEGQIRDSLYILKAEYIAKFGPLDEDIYSEAAYEEVGPSDTDLELANAAAQLEELKLQYASLMDGLGSDEDADGFEEEDIENAVLAEDRYGFGNGFEGLQFGSGGQDSGEFGLQNQFAERDADPKPKAPADYRLSVTNPFGNYRNSVRQTQSYVDPLNQAENPFADLDPEFSRPGPRPSFPKVTRPDTVMVSAPVLLSSTKVERPLTTAIPDYLPTTPNPFIPGATNWAQSPVGYIKMTVHNVEVKANDSMTFCKKYAVYEIHVQQEGWHWVIFRRYSQFYDLDKKLKSAGLLPSSDATLPPKTGLKRNNTAEGMARRVLEFQKYFHNIINHANIRSSHHIYQFVGPFQAGDTDAEWRRPVAAPQNFLVKGQVI